MKDFEVTIIVRVIAPDEKFAEQKADMACATLFDDYRVEDVNKYEYPGAD